MATIITDYAGLVAIASDLAGDYELGNDIDASGETFTPLGTFTGILDGKTFKITDLTITINAAGTQRGALIDTNQGTVQNLDIEDCVISVTATGVFGRAYAGALFVYNDGGIVTNCHVTATITAISTGSTSGFYSEVGGLGTWNWGTVTESYSTVTVSLTGGNNALAGGLLAAQGGTGSNSECYSTGDVTVTALKRAKAAGFIENVSSSGGVSDCYARGDASASGGDTENYAAGFIRDLDDTAVNCYSTGIPTGASGIGGFCQDDSGGTVTNCFWDTETSGTAVSDGGTGKTTAEMKTKATFIDAAWDFIVIWGISATINDGYPFLWALLPEDAESPRATVAVQDKITLESIRNIEMSARGRFRVSKEGEAIYRSRYARNA